MLVVTAKPEDADRISDELSTVLGEDRDAAVVLRLPESEALPYERLAEDEAVAHDRLGVLSALLAHDGDVDGPGLLLVASVAALCQRTLRPDQFQDTTHVLTVGQRVQTGALLVKWAAMGYSMEPTIEAPGTASRRGGILGRLPAQRLRARPHRVLRRRHRGHPHLRPADAALGGARSGASRSRPRSTTPSTRRPWRPSGRCWTLPPSTRTRSTACGRTVEPHGQRGEHRRGGVLRGLPVRRQPAGLSAVRGNCGRYGAGPGRAGSRGAGGAGGGGCWPPRSHAASCRMAGPRRGGRGARSRSASRATPPGCTSNG